MLKALDDLEKAVDRLMEKTREKVHDESGSIGSETLTEDSLTNGASGQTQQVNEEVAELIRRAIKRLRSL